MNYIVLDLEWNQCPEGKEKENSRIPFEIIEIGAVRFQFSCGIPKILSAASSDPLSTPHFTTGPERLLL